MGAKFTDVTVNERNFRIGKFSAQVGGFMTIKLTGIVTPMLKGMDLAKLQKAGQDNPEKIDISAFNVFNITSELGKLSEEDFNYIQSKCLGVCSESLGAGFTPVLNPNGSFGVVGLEDDTMTVLALTVHALVFNVKSFFGGSPLASIVGGFLGTFQQD